jgi:hypothetical protein
MAPLPVRSSAQPQASPAGKMRVRPPIQSFPDRQDAGEALHRGHPVGTVFTGRRATHV